MNLLLVILPKEEDGHRGTMSISEPPNLMTETVLHEMR